MSALSAPQTATMMRILLMPDEPDKDQWWERNAVDERQRNPRYRRSSRRSAAARLPSCGPAHGPTNMSGRSPAGTLQPENRLPDLDKSTGWPAPHLAKPS